MNAQDRDVLEHIAEALNRIAAALEASNEPRRLGRKPYPYVGGEQIEGDISSGEPPDD
jgi:hypothetical protein